MRSQRTRSTVVQRVVLRSAVAATLIAALLTAGLLSLAQASPVRSAVETPAASVTSTGSSVADLLPTPAFPGLNLPELPLPTPEPASGSDASDHCSDRSFWESRDYGDPGDYVAACGTWPSWIPRGETACLPGERGCEPASSDDSGAPAYAGPTDGPENSQGEPCMQGRDNDDPNC